MLLWLSELTVASFVLAYGAEHLSKKYGAKFIGRTLLSVATTLPEIAIVIYAAAGGLYGAAIGSGLGSNLLMMTLGLSIMLIIATTRLSKAPLKGVNVATFKLDKLFLLATAVISAALFIDGYNFIDGFIFAAMFGAYLAMALMEMRTEKKMAKIKQEKEIGNHPDHKVVKVEESLPEKGPSRELLKAALAFAAGTAGIFFGAEPFIHSLQEFSVEVGISVIVLAVIISPIAGEMPEKISMMLLARKGAAGASIAVANVLGSKVLNNSLLLAVAVFGAMYHGGFYANIPTDPILQYQMILVTVVTILALIPMFLRKEIGLRVGIMLAALYIISIFIQFLLPQDQALH